MKRNSASHFTTTHHSLFTDYATCIALMPGFPYQICLRLPGNCDMLRVSLLRSTRKSHQ
jgi:hypothetical protein